jgi:protein-disulfide isomerase
LDAENIFLFADRLGLDIAHFKNDIQQKHLIDKVEKDFESGIRSGVNRTPTFFINGKKFDGEWRDNHLLQYLKTILTGVPSL